MLWSSFHQPQPPSSCWKSYSRSRPASTCRLSRFGLIVLVTFKSFNVLATITFGRKLDIVCSVQPYGNDVRYSRLPKIAPATDGEISISIPRDVASAAAGKSSFDVRSAFVSLIAPDVATACFTPNGITGSVN